MQLNCSTLSNVEQLQNLKLKKFVFSSILGCVFSNPINSLCLRVYAISMRDFFFKKVILFDETNEITGGKSIIELLTSRNFF